MHPVKALDIDASYIGQKIQGGWTVTAVNHEGPGLLILVLEADGDRQVWDLTDADEVWFDLSWRCPSCGFDSDDTHELATHMRDGHLTYAHLLNVAMKAADRYRTVTA